jgi:hypothetical protein
MIDRTLMRPRDVISFANEAIVAAAGSVRVSWDDIRRAERPYSEKRLLALRDEWKPGYPGIHRVFELFRGSNQEIDRGQLSAILDEAMLLPADLEFAGVVWMTRASETMLTSGAGSDASWGELYAPLTVLLFEIGIAGIIDAQGRTIWSHQQPGYADTASHIEQIVGIAVHPAFHMALDLRTRESERRGHPSRS